MIAVSSFNNVVVCREEGPSGPLLVHRVPSAPPRWPNWTRESKIVKDVEGCGQSRTPNLVFVDQVNTHPNTFEYHIPK